MSDPNTTETKPINMIAEDDVAGLVQALVNAVMPGAHIAWQADGITCTDRWGHVWGVYKVRVS